MDTEFHYWVTGLIAYRAGFTKEEAQIISYASEYVDENDVCLRIMDRRKKLKPYGNFISQTMNILKPKHELLRIYPIFHFIPGEPDAYPARRRDGKMHLLNTTPNSENANTLLDSAFKAPMDLRLYRIGITTHCYVDTWAHQNFVGWYDAFNNIGLDPKPDIGHADAEHHPDWIGHLWEDSRLVDGSISNNLRFLSAAKALYGKYCGYLKTRRRPDQTAKWPQLQRELTLIFGPSYTGSKKYDAEKRLKAYQEKLDWFPEFDDRAWFDEAIETKTRGGRDSHAGIKARFTVFRDEYHWVDPEHRESTHWYRFQEAVKDHERFAIKLFSPTFANMGLELATL